MKLFSQKRHNSLPQATYSPDLALCDFFLFQKEERDMKGHRFDNMEDLKKKMELANIQTDEFEKCIQQCQHRLDKCINYTGSMLKVLKAVL